MNKLINETTVTVLSYPTTSTGKSASTTFVDMAKHRNIKIEALLHRLPDAKGEGVATLSLYESTTTTWNGAVATAITAGIVTGSLTSASDILLQKEIQVDEMSINASKRYINAYLTLPTGVQVSCIAQRAHPRFEKQS
jgi:hypothetical protein